MAPALTRLAAVAAALLAAPILAFYDVILPASRAGPPATCAHGCALWSNLAGDGNTRSQSDVDAKWSNGSSPAVRLCAMPANDPTADCDGWCYCRESNDESWGCCTMPAAALSVPEQINLQYVSDTARVAAFVTLDNYAPAAPVAQLATSAAALPTSANMSGLTNFWTQGGSSRQYSFHFVPFTQLRPATTYFYRVTSGVTWSAVYNFTTRDPQKELVFALAGDIGIYPYNNYELLRDREGSDIAFFLHMGDHAYQMSSDDGIRGDGYMTGWEDVLTSTAWATVMGNHEYYNDAYFMRYLNQTAGVGTATVRTTSDQVSPSPNGRWYSLEVGLLHLVVLDFNVYYSLEDDHVRKAQLLWANADLAAVNRTRTPWLLAAAHMPMQCSSITYDGVFTQPEHIARNASGLETPEAIAASAPWAGCTGTGVSGVAATAADFEPLFLAHGVDFFFCGHEHNYESTWPSIGMKPLQTDFIDPQGPIYVVEGAGGAPALDLFGGPAPFTRKQDSSWGYGRITVHNATHLTYQRIANRLCKDSCQASNCPPCPWAPGDVTDEWTVVQASHGPFAAAARDAGVALPVDAALHAL